MKKSKIVLWSLLHSLGVLVYVSILGLFFRYANQWFGQEDKFLTPIAMLMLLVLSAGVTGSLVLGKPILLYLDGQKSDSIKFLFWTFGWLLVLTLFAFFGLMLLK